MDLWSASQQRVQCWRDVRLFWRQNEVENQTTKAGDDEERENDTG